MPLKTKLISLALLLLLALPLLFNPIRKGAVLGVQEDGSGQEITTGQGKIAGGVMENKLESSNSENQDLIGLAVFDPETNTSVTAKNFSLASEVQVKYGEKTVDLIVSRVDQNLAEKVLLVLDEESFRAIGGDPEKTTEIEIIVNSSK